MSNQHNTTINFRALISAGLLSGLISFGAAQAQDFDAVEIKTTDLGNGIYMLEGAGGNLGASVGDDGIFLIDDQYAPLTPKIVAALAELGSGDIKYVINTHWHGDHTGGNENLGKDGTVIVAHRNVRKRMSEEAVSQMRNTTTPPSPDSALPTITYDANVDFHINGHTIEIKAVEAAHTDGDSIVHIKDANVLHMGDTLFNTWYPFIDVESGGSIHGMIAVHELGLSLANDGTKVIPGHGPLATRAQLQDAHDKLVSVRDAVQTRIDKGMSDEEIMADKPLDDLDLGWGGFLSAEQFLTLVLISMRS